MRKARIWLLIVDYILQIEPKRLIIVSRENSALYVGQTSGFVADQP